MTKTEKEISGYRLIVGYMGTFMVMIGIILLIPLVTILFYHEDYIYTLNFVIPSFVSIIIGYLLNIPIKKHKLGQLEKHQDTILVTLIWFITILICSFPFILTKQYTFIESVFEMTSGLSATGLTIIDDVSVCPKIFLFYRSLTEFVGGVGLVLLLTCIMSDRYALRIYTTEGHSDRLLPNLAKSARLIFGIYFLYVFVGVLAYCICGMSVFDAINFSMCAVSTGGFSTHPESIGYFSGMSNGLAIEIITIFLMVIGSINFLINLYILTGKFKKVINHSETKYLLYVIIPGCVLFSLILVGFGMSVSEGFRVGVFQYVSAFTTTGFQTVESIRALPHSIIIIMILTMLIGGGLGSTSGGIKQHRLVITIKGIYYGIRDSISNSRIVRTHYSSQMGYTKKLTDSDIKLTTSIAMMWIVVFFVGAFLVSIFAEKYGYTSGDSMFEFASALSGTGLSVGIVGAKDPVILSILSVGMFLGRLEISTVFIAVGKFINDIRDKKSLF